MTDFLVSLTAAYREFVRVWKRRAWMRRNRNLELPF
jgi:hypothetical protein